MAESGNIQAAVNQSAIHVATAEMMSLGETDVGPHCPLHRATDTET